MAYLKPNKLFKIHDTKLISICISQGFYKVCSFTGGDKKGADIGRRGREDIDCNRMRGRLDNGISTMRASVKITGKAISVTRTSP